MPPGALAGVVVLAVLAGLLLIGPAPEGLPATDGGFWLALAVAGTLGTALGDTLLGAAGLSLAGASVMTRAAVAVCFAMRSRAGLINAATYWASIVAVRTAGINVGDLLASRHGVGLGLRVSTACTLGALALTLVMWRRAGARRGDQPAVTSPLMPASTPGVSTPFVTRSCGAA